MKLYSYAVRNDSGFAPNPFWGYCTLACCKPKIRQSAEVGDWVVGTGSVKTVGNKRIVYAMKITEKLSFEQYSKEKRFKQKFPSNGLVQERGDNIYYKNKHGVFVLRQSYHSDESKEKDLSVNSVLISHHFFILGKRRR